MPLACVAARALAYSDAALGTSEGGVRTALAFAAVVSYGFETLAVQLALRKGIVKRYPIDD